MIYKAPESKILSLSVKAWLVY